MKQTAATRLIEFRPYPNRAERCIIGLIAFRSDGGVRAHLTANLRKVSAMDPSCDVQTLREGMDRIARDLERVREMLPIYEDGFGPLRLARAEGFVTFDREEEYEEGIQWALRVAADPLAVRQLRERTATSRLFIELKTVFGGLGWMARLGQGINDRVIVPRYPISSDEGLSIDFAVRTNGEYLMQTVDFRSPHHIGQRRSEAQAKALALGIAPQLSSIPVHSYFLVAGSNTDEAKRAIRLAERMCDRIYVHESRADMNDLMDRLNSVMGQPPLELALPH